MSTQENDTTTERTARPERASRTRQTNRSSRTGRYRQSRRTSRKVCPFCVSKAKYIDYKKPELLRPYLTEFGLIQARRKTGVCARHQRMLARAVKRARFLALLPMSPSHNLHSH